MAMAAASLPLPSGRMTFLGDSITYSGQYVEYTETMLRTRFPEKKWDIIDIGLPSETVSGLSEPGHAGGKFPRPDLHERLDRVLAKSKPDWVFACYGMNDGIYYPLEAVRMAAHITGIQKLRDEVQAVGAKMVHLTPPTFDPVPIKGKTLPAGLDRYEQPYEGYDSVLTAYSEWLVSQRKSGWSVVDVHGPMSEHLVARRRDKPEFILAPDGVHANATGHLIIAGALWSAWKIPAVAGECGVDLKQAKAVRGDVSGVARTATGLRWKWQTKLPMAMDPQWDVASLAQEQFVKKFNQFQLYAQGTSAPRYELKEGTNLLGVVTAEELKAGVNLLQYPKLSANVRAGEVLKVVRQRQKMLKDSWLATAGHLRPGMATGMPLPEAEKKAADLEKTLIELARPITLDLSLEPSLAPFPGAKSAWNGFDRYDFTVDGRPVLVVVPQFSGPGRPWVWHGEFFGHKPAPDIALLKQGFHIVYMSVPDMLGAPGAVKHWNALYQELSGRYGFSSKAALVGLSRGGLYCYNWAASNPDKVSCIYADAPVCDFKSWPGGKGKGKGSSRDWQLVLGQYGFKSEFEALTYSKNPIDNLTGLARARVPLLHVYGDADDVVPWEENTGLIAERYKKLGGDITLIAKPGVGHHPHGLDDSTPIVEFIRKHASVAK